MEQATAFWLVPLFLVAFAGFWLLVCRLLLVMAGWPTLERRFPDRDETELDRFRFKSGSMGSLLPRPFGVGFGNCMTLDITHTGLRVNVWWMFRGFSKPFLVPWAEISAQEDNILFFKQVRLTFGNPEVGRLVLSRGLARKLAEASRGRFRLPPSP